MKKVKRKGVSPVIATVLLIALVIVIALIIFLFMRGLGEEAITKFGNENIKLACEKVEFEPSYSDGMIFVSNLGTVPIYDIKAELVEGGNYKTIEFKKTLGEEWPASGLTQGNVISIPLPEENLEKVIITPVLIGKTSKGVKKTYTCEGGVYNSEIIF